MHLGKLGPIMCRGCCLVSTGRHMPEQDFDGLDDRPGDAGGSRRFFLGRHGFLNSYDDDDFAEVHSPRWPGKAPRDDIHRK